ncbi:cell wall protein IFF7-like [Rhagoletis pomonella]|uniref:cell wall protein IFF7-like n=1 Tax=Rhagoletis pomonella TaxID=28610 RepID=UPI00178764B4|nr:cell wall protein IFF7-like [Rhagoletis pomonella]XP_036344342.1 cell wall protein IFF7-like [Rhagoletis pomonella]
MTCQQLDCMQRHAEGHGDLWHKQASILNETHQKTDTTAAVCRTAYTRGAVAVAATAAATATIDIAPDTLAPDSLVNGTTAAAGAAITEVLATPTTVNADIACSTGDSIVAAVGGCVLGAPMLTVTGGSGGDGMQVEIAATSALCANRSQVAKAATEMKATTTCNGSGNNNSNNSSSNNSTTSSNSSHAIGASRKIITSAATLATTAAVRSTGIRGEAAHATGTGTTTTATTSATATKPNDWVVIPVFADIVKLALAGREECLQR